MHLHRFAFVVPVFAAATLLAARPAFAQDEAAAPPAIVTTPAPAPVTTPAPEVPAEKKIRASVAIERVGGLSYSNVSSGDGGGSLSAVGYVIGGPSVNPDSSPRLGVDAIFGNNITLGAALAGGTYAVKTKDQDASDHLSLFIIAPRIGYRIPLSKNWDLTPRGVVTIEGGTLSAGDDDSAKSSVVALGLGAEGVLAYRATSSFNLLAGVGFDHTVAASATTRSTTYGINGEAVTSADTKGIDGALFTLQLWIGIGGYL
ncbi:MAG: hypothetical protein JWP97_415 [Labilithrix sp.]|nr:hypothetical protein [Labilithrix sp.]